MRYISDWFFRWLIPLGFSFFGYFPLSCLPEFVRSELSVQGLLSLSLAPLSWLSLEYLVSAGCVTVCVQYTDRIRGTETVQHPGKHQDTNWGESINLDVTGSINASRLDLLIFWSFFSFLIITSLGFTPRWTSKGAKGGDVEINSENKVEDPVTD